MSSMFGPNKYARGNQDDTGWVTVALSDTTNFALDNAANPTQVRRLDHVVHLRGALKVLTLSYIEGASPRVFGTLDSEFRPPADRSDAYYACVSDGSSHWALRVFPTGTLSAYRYGPGTQPINTWLPFTVSWVVD